MTILDKLEKGKINASFVQTDITKLLLRSIDSKKLKWGDINLTLHGSRVLKATDSFFLEIVINELLDNSCRYKSSKVGVSINTSGENTRIMVEDDGEGIEKDELAKVFEPYFRIKKHRRRSNRAGLGLTTVEAITNKLEGKIKLDSSPNWGTKVELTL